MGAAGSAASAGGAGRGIRVVPGDDAGAVMDALAARLEDDGPAVLPAADPEREAAFARSAEASGGVEAETALIVSTSGSTAAPKRTALPAAALSASAEAVTAELDRRVALALASSGIAGVPVAGGAGQWQWVLCLPPRYIAGAQVLARAVLGGTEPVVAGTARFRPAALVDAYERLDAPCLAISLVPAQVQLLLDAAEARGRNAERYGADPQELREVMAAFDAILVGGQALPRAVRERAEELDWQLVPTYGASETAGGCVYDGVPLGGVELRIEDGEVLIGGPVLASGYVGAPGRTARAFPSLDGRRWYRAGDAGELLPDPEVPGGARLRVTGRLDDVIISGGEKVLPGKLETLLRELPGLSEAVVIAAPSQRWGQVPVVVVASRGMAARPGTPLRADDCRLVLPDDGGRDGTPIGSEGDARALLGMRERAAALGRAFRPAALLRVPELPRLLSGKPDRRALAALLARHFPALP